MSPLGSALMVLSLTGTVQVTWKLRSGFILWALADIGWVFIDWQAGLKEEAVLFAVFFALAIYGFWSWKKR